MARLAGATISIRCYSLRPQEEIQNHNPMAFLHAPCRIEQRSHSQAFFSCTTLSRDPAGPVGGHVPLLGTGLDFRTFVVHAAVHGQSTELTLRHLADADHVVDLQDLSQGRLVHIRLLSVARDALRVHPLGKLIRTLTDKLLGAFVLGHPHIARSPQPTVGLGKACGGQLLALPQGLVKPKLVRPQFFLRLQDFFADVVIAQINVVVVTLVHKDGLRARPRHAAGLAPPAARSSAARLPPEI
mmetsp:Transcript_35666/g.90740  ORF Transcript_35666/g.90740 Transcript_35666/m.90740 type:complete len:242 (-) Transcript_35666:91-816(-)